MTSLSVITTTYNCSAFISQAVQSILNQTYKDFEYIIIDDGSTDNTEKIMSKFNDNRIKYFKIEHVGRSGALNIGLAKSNYDIIALMDADDISHPLRFEKQLQIFKNSNQFIFCDTGYFENNKIKYVIHNRYNIEDLNEKLILHGHFNNSSSMFSKSHLLSNGCYNEKLDVYEDYDLWLKLRHKSEFCVLPGIYHYMRLRDNSMTTSNPSKLKHILYSIQEKYFIDLGKSCGVYSIKNQTLLKGWREYFYGDKEAARKYWRKIKFFKRGLKVNIAFLFSFFPIKFIEYLKNNRIRLVLSYLLLNIKSFGKTQKEFSLVLNKILSDLDWESEN